MPRLVFGLVAGALGTLMIVLVVGPVAGLPTALALGFSGSLVAVMVWWLIRRYGVPWRRFRLQRSVSYFTTGVVFGLSVGLLFAPPPARPEDMVGVVELADGRIKRSHDVLR